jgi:apolipoprotein N-acyltransferase
VSRTIRRFRDLLLAACSGGLLSLPFAFGALSPLAFVAFVPYFAAVDGKGGGEAFKISFVFGLVFCLVSGFGLSHVTVTGYLLLSAYLALYAALAGMFSAPFMKPSAELDQTYFSRNLRSVFFVPAIWTAAEYARSHVFGGFPWALVGNALWKLPLFIQIADVTGVWGISFFVLFVNVALFKLLREIVFDTGAERPLRRNYLFQLAGTGALGVALVAGYGAACLAEWDAFYRSAREKAVLRVAVVQGNIPQDQKWDAKIKGIIFEKYKRLTFMCAIEKSDLIVWPETSFPGYLEDEALMAAGLRTTVRQSRTEVLVGAPTLGDLESQGVRFYNSAIHYDSTGEEKKRYSKLHLVPFGEFVPFEPVLGVIRRFVEIGSFTPGKERTVFDVTSRYQKNKISAKFAALICFEDMFPGEVRLFCLKGANFLVNITNDAWFGDSAVPYQHGQSSIFRAVENRVNVVRAANTGWSCFISPEGRVLTSVEDKGREINVTGHRGQDIVLRRVTTFYTRFGDVFMLLVAGLCLAAYRDTQKHSGYSRL